MASKKQKQSGGWDKREVWEARENAKIDQAVKYRDRTNKCPVCKARPRGHGVTCGNIECIHVWILGKPKEKHNESR